MTKNAKPSPAQVAQFHRDAITAALAFLSARGIVSIRELNAVKGRGLLDVPLWKLLETEGKYGGPFISKGVRDLEIRLGRPPTRSYGTWPERLLVRHLGVPPAGRSWSKSPDYCCQLDHVTERAELITAILRHPAHAQQILDQSLLGCVVLRSEHGRLGRATISASDPWRRYREADPQLPVWDRRAETWLSLEAVTIENPHDEPKPPSHAG